MVGYAGVDNKGLGGLELEYDRKLSGHPGKQTIVRDPTGRAIDVISSSPVQEGADVFTTLDHTIQAKAEQVLRETVATWGAKAATAIVLDPTTGEVLAMAQAPGYNANNTSTVPAALTSATAPSPTPTSRARRSSSSRSPRRSRRGSSTPTTRFTLPYLYHYGSCVQCGVHDAESRPTETLTVAQILSHSSNVGAVTIAGKLGSSTLAKWVRALRLRPADRDRLPR